jgi:predicted dehydrogenase
MPCRPACLIWAVRFGVLGTGYWAEETHCAAIATSDGHELVGVWGRDPAKADRVASRWGGRGFSDLDALLAGVDAVAIALPPDVQPPLAVRAAEAGCHLLLDKPIALDTASATSMVAAVERHGVSDVVFFTRRFRPPVREWLDVSSTTAWDGATGRWLVGGTFEPGSPWEPSVWRREHGALWDLTPHLLSIVVPALGSVSSVKAERGTKDLVHLVLGHASGGVSSLSVAHTLGPSVSIIDVELFGETGRSSMPDDTSTTPIRAFQGALRELEACVVSGQRSPIDVRLGAHTVSVLEAARESLAAPGSPVAVTWQHDSIR